MFFQKNVDLHSSEAMVAFLKGHFRYYTGGSWRHTTSYAHCVKLPQLGLTAQQYDRAFEMLSMPEVEAMMSSVIADFTSEHRNEFTILANGRSNGYLVLCHTEWWDPDHDRFFRSLSEPPSPNHVLDGPPLVLKAVTGRGVDSDVDWDRLSLDELQNKARLVQSFDAACDRIRDGFLNLLAEYEVTELVVPMPPTVRGRQPRDR